MTNCDGLHAGRADIIAGVRRRLEQSLPRLANRTLPFITVTYAQSLDGCIAGANGETLRLSNPQSQKMTHHLRAIHDAILVGINTVIRDNPRLNVRLVEGSDPQPVVIDSQLRLPLDANLLRDPCVRPLVVTGKTACERKERELVRRGAQVVRVGEREDAMLDLRQAFAEVRRRGCRSVMVEGGASIITSMLTARLADQYVLTISPRLVAGMRAVKPQDDGNGPFMARLHNLQHEWMAEDLVLRGDMESELCGEGDRPVEDSVVSMISPSNDAPCGANDEESR